MREAFFFREVRFGDGFVEARLAIADLPFKVDRRRLANADLPDFFFTDFRVAVALFLVLDALLVRLLLAVFFVAETRALELLLDDVLFLTLVAAVFDLARVLLVACFTIYSPRLSWFQMLSRTK